MKNRIALFCGLVLVTLGSKTFAQVDPNFHIYLCIGQSNMEGQGTAENADKTGYDATRFRVFGTVTCNSNGRNYTVGTQTSAGTPIFRCNTKVSLVENFGKVYLAGQPSNVKVGVVPVAIAGCKIELFDKANYQSYANGVESWMKSIITEYGGNPYSRLITVAKEAQKVGVIKGILFHQGESNSGEDAWRGKVKGVYDNIIADLGLTAANTPILIGEMLSPGQCSGHNTVIAKMPSTIAKAYVISSASCGGQSDNLHFTSAGYRLLGQRYAEKMLSLLPPVSTCSTPAPTVPAATINYELGETAKQLSATGTALKWYTGASATSSATAPTPNTAVSATTTYYVSQTLNGCEGDKTPIVVKVTSNFKVYSVTTAPVIDGAIDAIWTNASVMPAAATKLLSGTVTNAADLSGSFKALWDNTYLYVLADVTDDTKVNDSPNSYDDDAVEVYIDINNDKATTYGANDAQYTFGWNDGTIVGALPSGRSTTGITYSAVARTGGYIVEARIPWSTLQKTPSIGQLVGLDFMINDDDDNSTRDAKLSWNSTTDMAYQDPSLFGTAILATSIVTEIEDESAGLNSSEVVCYPNPFTNGFTVDAKGNFDYALLNASGEVVYSGNGEDQIQLGEGLSGGIYFLKIKQAATSKVVKICKN